MSPHKQTPGRLTANESSNAVITLDNPWDEAKFKEEVGKNIAKHATKTREQWRCELLDA